MHVCCSGLQCVAVRCSALQCVAVRCSALQCIAACCSMLQHVAACCIMLHCVTVCCSVLQCAAVCCSVLQCAAVRYTQNTLTHTPPHTLTAHVHKRSLPLLLSHTPTPTSIPTFALWRTGGGKEARRGCSPQKVGPTRRLTTLILTRSSPCFPHSLNLPRTLCEVALSCQSRSQQLFSTPYKLH